MHRTLARLACGIAALALWAGVARAEVGELKVAQQYGIGYLPLMVFPIFVSLEKLDKRLLEASKDLGAEPWGTFRQVTLPLLLTVTPKGTYKAVMAPL